MSDNHQQSSFDKAIGEFTQDLRRRDVEDFHSTKLHHLKTTIANLQAEQHSHRRLQDLTRLQRFLEAIEQFGKVISTFYRNNDVLAFVWGPLKFLLQATSINDKAFGEVLSAYEHMGENLPLLVQCQGLFRVRPHMVRVLALMYEGILKFQRIILRYFQQPLWQRVFSESWTTCKSRFSNIFRDIAQHRSLIESQATPSQVEEIQENIQRSRQAQEIEFDEQNERRLGEVHNWLRPADVDVDHATFLKVRADYPGTGKWLLENESFKDWFHPQYAPVPPLLWLSGIPGAGKTMLASLVVQKASELKPAPTVLYFYCKHENPERDNFVALGRSLLAQFLHHNNELLPSFYQKFCRSGQVVLSSPILVEELLTLAFGNCKSAYIILDGLDECPRDQRKYITKWFRKLIEDLPSKEADRLRCLFVSQDDGPARKDFDDLASIKIADEDTQHDIEEYCRVQARKLLENNPSLPGEKVDWIAMTVSKSVKGRLPHHSCSFFFIHSLTRHQGLFLLASLIWTNLSNHTSIERLEKELEPNVFPKQINDAYRRIMVRINEQAVPEAREDSLRLLRWLVCAKRPLKWHEIQVMNSVNRDERRIAFERQSFIKHPKDLLASLVEKRSDGSLDFCHLSVKFFLLEEEGYVEPSSEELNLAILCIDYLNLPAFILPPTKEGVLNGDYGFMDYAALFWLRHMEVGIALKDGEKEEVMEDLSESLEILIDRHWNSPTIQLTLAKRHSDKLQHFRELPFYDQLEQAVASTKQQLKKFGNTKMEENALNLARMVCDVRRILESTINDDSQHIDRTFIEERYGTNIYKCPRFSCQFFTVGFISAAERDKHISKHERPFRCTDETCVGYTFGFSTTVEREKHMRENHSEGTVQDEEFPTEQDVYRSILDQQNAAERRKSPDPPNRDDGTGDATTAASEEALSEAESEVEPQYQPRLKRPRQTEFKCPYCKIVYRKRYNLSSHLLSHASQRSHVCEVCGLGFARPNDLKRHKNTHTGDKSFVCGGFLRNGASWGCGRSFARGDTLDKHYESKVGRACIQPLLQEQETVE
ncbi:hypothetical protein PFICI_11263 [Pestalotiopsis fici W106-1]|uniref:C2H2-type domain-containing protein n=1 Tax=Pestalotiopsis fici (strain W106-1 / CGMCC3.15140) TaxID=1229662 RepID=W3WUB5_PESFW|nr:uncharacterized protein PFICI_11263 [Pestalotiopsis fici W106-1]ETS77389.1 hypothetical protein PFICI_11263 [Pestalotiopsis fici W106-1]